MLNNLSPLGIVFLIMIAFLLYGPKKLPEMGKTVGQTIKAFRSGLVDTKDIKEKGEERDMEEKGGKTR